MQNARYRQLDKDPTLKLTAEELAEGWFFCCDWDGMLIHKSGPEAECCSCLNSEKNKEKDNGKSKKRNKNIP